MLYRDTTIDELRKFYGSCLVKQSKAGYCVRKVDKGENGVYYPDLQIDVDFMGRPTQDGEEIDLFSGFVMPEVVTAMGLNPQEVTGVLFCQQFYIQNELHGRICYLTICDPGESDYVLLIRPLRDTIANDTYRPFSDVWHGLAYRHIQESVGGVYTERTLYEVVPMGFNATRTDKKQTEAEKHAVRVEVVKAANRYLDIVEDLSYLETKPIDDDTLDIPGLTPGTETVTLWIYRDDINASDGWVIDTYGRLLAPNEVIPCKHRFTDETVIAEYHIWRNIPEAALVLAWEKASPLDDHEFRVIMKPDQMTKAQRCRAEQLEKQIENVCTERDGKFYCSHKIGDGWKLWQHLNN